MSIDGISIVSLTPSAVLLIGILMMFSGRLVPRPTLQDKKDECREWREAYEKEREARALTDAQVRELLEVAKTSNAFIGAVFQNSEHIRSQGGSNVSSQTTG